MDALKWKVIEDFNKFLSRLEYGYVDDYSHIIDTISFIYNFNKFDKPDNIYEYLLNN